MEREGYLMQDRRERFVNKPKGGTRAWFVNAWRVVDADLRDLFQPWEETKGAAQEAARQMGITIVGTVRQGRAVRS